MLQTIRAKAVQELRTSLTMLKVAVKFGIQKVCVKILDRLDK